VRARSIKFTLDQRGLSAKDRRENLEGAFEVESGSGPLLIVDDVVTTGSTALSLASASAVAGFEVAGICVVARRNSSGQTRESKKA
jgi:predicted amidophosphoribosyltransferase